ncbi:MAG: site-2 protease family protein [Candidatus Hadarchaeota archaeon]
MDLLIFLAAVGVLWLAVGLGYRRYKLKARGVLLYPGAMIWRTTKGLGVIDRLATKHKRLWSSYGTVAAALGVFFMIFVFVNIILNAVVLLSQPARAVTGVTFVLPGLVPGLSIVAWLISVGLVLVIHEFSHGLLLRSQGLKTKFTGVMLFLFIPGAFVEPDEKELKKAPRHKRMKMFAAGPVSNVVFSFFFLFLLLVFLVPKSGVYVYAVADNYPAENLAENLLGAKILAIENQGLRTPIDTYENFSKFLLQSSPGENIVLSTDKGDYPLTLANSPDNENIGTIGILTITSTPRSDFINPLLVLGSAVGVFLGAPVFHPFVYDAIVPWAVIDVLKWLFVLNIGVGLFNLLPAKPLDGGYLFEALLEKKASRERARKIVKVFSFLVLFLILVNLVPSLLRRAFGG